MSYHRFKIAQAVTSITPDMPPGFFVIVRLLPWVGGEPRYRVMSTIDGHLTAVLESQIRPVAKERTASVHLPLSLHADSHTTRSSLNDPAYRSAELWDQV